MTATNTTTKMNSIKYLKSSLLLTIVIASLVIVAPLTLAAPPGSSSSNSPTPSETPSSEVSSQVSSKSSPVSQIDASLKSDISKGVDQVAKTAPIVSNEGQKSSISDLGSNSVDVSSRQSRAVDSSTVSSAANRAESTPAVVKSTSSSKKALDSSPEATPAATTTSATAASESKLSSTTKSSSNSSLSAKASPNKSASSKSTSSSSSSSNGPSSTNIGHYVSKHDSYSAIAERHLFAEAMKKSDRRRAQSVSMDRSSKFGDMISSLKDVTTNGLSRSIGASVRSILKSKYSVPAYVASALLGAVALMAFYESPISPLPVPSLPEPPIGRFPPEFPSLPSNTQVPFRYNANQQQQYNNAYQRSFQQQPQQPVSGGKQQLHTGTHQVNDRISFPGQTNNQASQQQPDVAQRKSSPEYEPVVSSRSFFSGTGSTKAGSANILNNRIGVVGGAGGQHQSTGGPLDYFGGSVDNMMNGVLNYGSHQFSANGVEAKLGSATNSPSGGLSSSHLINKFKSYFSRSSPPTTSTNQMKSPNPYEQYQRMSLMQAFMKDTSLIPSFMSGNANKVSSAASSSASLNNNNKVKAQPGNTLTERMINTSNMQGQAQFSYPPDSLIQSPSTATKPKPQQASSATSSASGIMKAADKLAHALLETLSSGLQRHSSPSSSASPSSPSPWSGSGGSGQASAKSAGNQQDQMISRKSASGDSDLSPIESTSSLSPSLSASMVNGQTKSSADMSVASPVSPKSDNSVGDHNQQGANSRSSEDDAALATNLKQQESKQTSSASSVSSVASQTSTNLTRKARSIESQQRPSTAANINNVVDYVSENYAQNRLLYSTILHQVGLGHATQYMDNILIGANNLN